jgi:hypothetical protein
MPLGDIPPMYLFIVNLVLSVAVLAVCTELARRWERRRMLSIEFAMVGVNHLLSFLFFSYWLFYGSSTGLLLAAVSAILLASFLSQAMTTMLYSPRVPLNWIFVAYVFIPVIYIITSDLQLTLLQTMMLSSLVVSISFMMVAMAGRKRMRAYGVAGMAAGLVAIMYIYSFMLGSNLKVLWCAVDALSLYAYYGFLRISSKRPHEFIADFDGRKDGV